MADFVLDPNYLRNLTAAAAKARRDLLWDIAMDATRLAPIDTGEMVHSIDVDEARGRVTVGSDHWHFVEYGTRYMDAQPFMRPALYRQRGGS